MIIVTKNIECTIFSCQSFYPPISIKPSRRSKFKTNVVWITGQGQHAIIGTHLQWPISALLTLTALCGYRKEIFQRGT